ncbi:globin domain-containing protein [Streptomyces sp. HB2AG]|uniref:globin domain-containing protein n=1 Tax=Streptomyces sp. HB2AG TaxID=2983400 RepID=UPI0022AA14C6|nr:globin domain-containing protein [Streptomyces sp. HB2AG]MCZ2524948.1 globin domain-containing protein [Streptomyces sp. HB2AG]
MISSGKTDMDDYHSLLARHHAMRLRRQILSPGGPASPGAGSPRRGVDLRDGAAVQQLIMQNLHLVTPFDQLIDHLYEAMFRRRPYLRSMFPESMDFQQDRLGQMFTYMIDNLHDPEQVASVFEQLGRGHRKLGVQPVHYETFEEALREALRVQAGPQWTPELDDAWTRALRFAVGAMVDGAEAALTEPPYWTAEVVGHERRGPDLAVLRILPNEPYSYRAGQHGSLQSPLMPRAWRRYSIACAPRQDDVLEFHVRLTGPGGMSEALVEHTRVGDTLRLGPAGGTTTLDGAPLGDLLLVAGGTGLAQAKAILQDLATRHADGRQVHLFVGARTRSDLYDWDDLADLDARCPWLEVVPVISEDPWFQGETGMVADALDRHGDWSAHLALVSGPPKMIESTVTRLIEAGTPAGRILHDPVPGIGEA